VQVKSWSRDVVLRVSGAADTISHERVLLAALEAGPRHWARLAPSFGRLPPVWRARIVAALRTGFLLGQFVQARGSNSFGRDSAIRMGFSCPLDVRFVWWGSISKYEPPLPIV